MYLSVREYSRERERLGEREGEISVYSPLFSAMRPRDKSSLREEKYTLSNSEGFS